VFNVTEPGHGPWVALTVAVLIAGLLVRARRNYLAIPEIPGRSPASSPMTTPPDCMVVIPARNEEGSIARSVASFPHDTVIVVDDHSEDGTAEAARKAGAGVLRAPDLPRGAIGKSNACAAGARVLTSRWILFADADTWFEPGFLDSAVAYAEANGLAFVSIYLRAECETLAERTLVPLAVALYFSGASPSASNANGPVAMFNGQCVLIRRAAYEFIGGHTAALTSLIEDVKLASVAQMHRMKIGVARAPKLGHARMQIGLAGIWSGFERNAFRFMVVSPWIGITILITVCSLALWAPILGMLLREHHPLAAMVFALLPIVLLWPWYRWGLGALLSPLAIYGMLPVIAHAFLSAFTGRRIEWKGRTI
jgi:chlorobactene glucosyltransferase